MAFIAGTPIFTDSGWKNVEDIAGRDKVLVKGFINYTQFTQPFALSKIKHDGKLISLGANVWDVTVTPDHTIPVSLNVRDFYDIKAQDLAPKADLKVLRRFHYRPQGDPPKETIIVTDEVGKRRTTISPEDWYVLVGYTLTRGYLRRHGTKYELYIYTASERQAKDVYILGGILTKYGIPWSLRRYGQSDTIYISYKSTLPARLRLRLGSMKRSEMYLPDSMIYRSTRSLVTLFINTLVDTYTRKETVIKNKFQLSTTNVKLMDSLTLFATLGGYGVARAVTVRSGTEGRFGPVKNDHYVLSFTEGHRSYRIDRVDVVDYSGYVYNIDIFDGQVFTKNGALPVWVNPK